MTAPPRNGHALDAEEALAREMAEIADHVLTSEGDPKVYEAEVRELESAFRHLLRVRFAQYRERIAVLEKERDEHECGESIANYSRDLEERTAQLEESRAGVKKYREKADARGKHIASLIEIGKSKQRFLLNAGRAVHEQLLNILARAETAERETDEARAALETAEGLLMEATHHSVSLDPSGFRGRVEAWLKGRGRILVMPLLALALLGIGGIGGCALAADAVGGAIVPCRIPARDRIAAPPTVGHDLAGMRALCGERPVVLGVPADLALARSFAPHEATASAKIGGDGWRGLESRADLTLGQATDRACVAQAVAAGCHEQQGSGRTVYGDGPDILSSDWQGHPSPQGAPQVAPALDVDLLLLPALAPCPCHATNIGNPLCAVKGKAPRIVCDGSTTYVDATVGPSLGPPRHRREPRRTNDLAAIATERPQDRGRASVRPWPRSWLLGHPGEPIRTCVKGRGRIA